MENPPFFVKEIHLQLVDFPASYVRLPECSLQKKSSKAGVLYYRRMLDVSFQWWWFFLSKWSNCYATNRTSPTWQTLHKMAILNNTEKSDPCTVYLSTFIYKIYKPQQWTKCRQSNITYIGPMGSGNWSKKNSTTVSTTWDRCPKVRRSGEDSPQIPAHFFGDWTGQGASFLDPSLALPWLHGVLRAYKVTTPGTAAEAMKQWSVLQSWRSGKEEVAQRIPRQRAISTIVRMRHRPVLFSRKTTLLRDFFWWSAVTTRWAQKPSYKLGYISIHRSELSAVTH